jgi:hypothetical protein
MFKNPPEQKLEPDFDQEKQELLEQAQELVYQIDKHLDYVSSFFSELHTPEVEKRFELATTYFEELQALCYEYDFLDEELADGQWRIEELESLVIQKQEEKE